MAGLAPDIHAAWTLYSPARGSAALIVDDRLASTRDA
jgi:hypothetical protein